MNDAQSAPAARKPSEIFGDRMKAVREAKRWTQQDMADRLAEMGNPTDRATVARTESRSRGVSLDDALAYTAALGPSLVHMVTPLGDDDQVAIAGDYIVPAPTLRRWMKDQWPLRPEDARTFAFERPDHEVDARGYSALHTARRAMEELLEVAVGSGGAARVPGLVEIVTTSLADVRRGAEDYLRSNESLFARGQGNDDGSR